MTTVFVKEATMTFEPMKIDTDAPAVEAERIPAFIITKDGVDTVYTVPREISGPTAIQALEVFITRGEAATVLWLVQHALGEEGMNAVLECEQLTLPQSRVLLQRIGEHYIGRVKELGKAQE
jgi:hypothetical protein